MALSDLTLAVETGVKGRPFRAKIEGLTAGTQVAAEGPFGGFGVVNGFLVHPSLDNGFPSTVVALTERDPATGENKTTHVGIDVFGRTTIAARAAELVPGGATLDDYGAYGADETDGSTGWYVRADMTSGVRVTGPVVVVDGAPEKIAEWNFHAGTGNIGGVSKTFAEMWTDDPDYDAHDPATIVGGVGYQKTGTVSGSDAIVATPQLLAALDIPSGLVYEVHYILSSPGAGWAGMNTEILDLPDFNEEFFYAARVGTGTYRRIASSSQFTALSLPTGEHRAAIRNAVGVFEISIDGAVVVPASFPLDNLTVTNAFALSVAISYVSGAAPSATIHHVDFYRSADVPDLTVISAP